MIFTFRYGQRSATKKPKISPDAEVAAKAELGAGTVRPIELDGKSLTLKERAELERRRRAAELEGVSAVSLVGLGGNERAELEARTTVANTAIG